MLDYFVFLFIRVSCILIRYFCLFISLFICYFLFVLFVVCHLFMICYMLFLLLNDFICFIS